ALKNANLSYSHAGLHVSTVENQESGGEGDSATTKPLPYDAGPIPDFLRRTAPSGGNGARTLSDIDAVLEELAARGEQPPWRPRGRGWHPMGGPPPAGAGASGVFQETLGPCPCSGPRV